MNLCLGNEPRLKNYSIKALIWKLKFTVKKQEADTFLCIISNRLKLISLEISFSVLDSETLYSKSISDYEKQNELIHLCANGGKGS